jgi:tetratricopeptide (TPR) repeat protein
VSYNSKVHVAVHVAFIAVLCLTAWVVVSDRFYALAGEGRLFGLGEHPLWHAHDAARFAAQPGMPDRMLAFHLGQAAVFEFHKRDDQRTFCDPRLEVVSRELLEEYHAIEAAIERDQLGWEEWLSRHELLMILVDLSESNHHAMSATLLSSNHWRCVYSDPIAAIFLHVDALSAADVSPVNFARRLFVSEDLLSPAAAQDRASNSTADEPDPRLYEARALYGLGVNLVNRRAFDLQLARSILSLAAKRASAARCPSQRPHECDRLRGQIYRTLSPLTGSTPHADDMANFSWDISSMLDLARSRYFLERARKQRPDDLITLFQLFEVAELQMDHRTRSELKQNLLQYRPRTPVQRKWLDALGKKLSSEKAVTDHDRSPDQVNLLDLDDVRRAMFQHLANGRPDLALALLQACGSVKGPLPWDLAEKFASLSMFLGSPGTGLEPDQIEGEVDTLTLKSRRGTVQLIMGRPDLCIEAYQAALRLDPSNIEANLGLARAYLELGDAMKTIEFCENALGSEVINSVMRNNLEWISDLAHHFTSER